MSVPVRGLAALVGGVLVASMAGCSEKLTITQIPDFYTPDLKTVVVAPFRNQTNWKGAGEIISDKVAAGLMANGTYKVYNRNDLKTLLDESDLQVALGADPNAAAEKLKKLTQVQAILMGTVTTYATTTNRQNREEPIYATDAYGNTYVAGMRKFVHTRNEANVSVTANLVRIADGATLHATAEPAWARVWAEGSPPSKDAYACAAEAADSVGGQLVASFAPVRRVISVNPKKALRTATELYDNEWTYSDRFAGDAEKLYVVVSLPPSCNRNKFRLVIVRAGQRQDLAAQDIVWDSKYKGFGYLFSPKEIFAKGGAGDYEVKFYSGGTPVMRHSFRMQ